MLLAACSEAANMRDFLRVTELGFFGSFLSQVTLYFLNEPMFVDEYHDTSWTRGQYPAAPPDILHIDLRWSIIFYH